MLKPIILPLMTLKSRIAILQDRAKNIQSFARLDIDGLCSPLVRTQTKSQNNNEIGMRIRQLYFTIEFEDYTL